MLMLVIVELFYPQIKAKQLWLSVEITSPQTLMSTKGSFKREAKCIKRPQFKTKMHKMTILKKEKLKNTNI